jgi:hypothetical protein
MTIYLLSYYIAYEGDFGHQYFTTREGAERAKTEWEAQEAAESPAWKNDWEITEVEVEDGTA